jgi:ferritin
MLNKRVVDLINGQINKEFYSSFLYLDMSNYYFDQSLSGFGNWFDIQTKEEYAHAMLFVQYLRNNGEKVILSPLAGPDVKFDGFKQPLEAAYEHELFISKSINDIYGEVYELRDFKTMQFLDWFVKEQGEEEQNVDDLNKRFDLFAHDPRGLYLLDAELATRTFTPPSLVL